MKTLHLFFLTSIIFLTFSLTVRSQAEPPSFSFLDRVGIEKISWQSVTDGSRETPPGLLLYSQPFSCPPYDLVVSQNHEPIVQVADDFILTSTSPVNVIRWWFLMGESSTDWVISIFNNSNCLPGSLVNTWSITANSVHEEIVCGLAISVNEFWTKLDPPFIPVTGQPYWISIQASGTSGWCYWTCYGNPGEYLNCPGVFQGAMFGVYEFIPIQWYMGLAKDFTFELYFDGPPPPPAGVPVTNWAIGIGILFIILAALMRYRRLL